MASMRVLVLTTEPISAGQLRDALGAELCTGETEVKVVAPAVHESALRFWVSDADEAIAKAEEVRRQTVERLGADGVAAAGDTGESDLEQAVGDALQDFDADRIVVFTRPESERRYREDIDAQELEQRLGRPVKHALVSSVR
jgi:hypothetical protein